MRLNPEYLVTFNAVAELGSVSKAAEHLNLSQPAVSNQLRGLQELVGGALYTRRARGITLTPLGRELLPHAQAVARSVRRVGEFAAEQRQRAPRFVRLGASWTLSATATRLVGQFSARGQDIAVTSGYSPQLLAAVAAGELDAALVVDAPHQLPEGLEARRFSAEDLRLLLPAGHPLAGQGYVPVQALAHERLLWVMPEASVRRRAERLLRHAGVNPPGLELGGFLGVRSALLMGLGVAILPASLVAAELRAGLLGSVGLEAPDLTLGHHVVAPPAALLPSSVQEVIAALAAHASEGS